ncbi:MAG: Flp pilus assembly protein TadD, partial [Gammaproteobacteria bacterium]
NKSNIKRYEYYFLSAKAQLISLQYETALSNFNKTIELSPRFAEGYMYRAVTHRQLNMKQEACEDYNMAAGLGFKSISEEAVGRYCEE